MSGDRRGQWDAYVMTRYRPRLFRKLADGTRRSIECVPGGPPTPTATVQPGESILIETRDGQVEVSWLDGEEALVRVLPNPSQPV